MTCIVAWVPMLGFTFRCCLLDTQYFLNKRLCILFYTGPQNSVASSPHSPHPLSKSGRGPEAAEKLAVGGRGWAGRELGCLEVKGIHYPSASQGWAWSGSFLCTAWEILTCDPSPPTHLPPPLLLPWKFHKPCVCQAASLDLSKPPKQVPST